SVMPGKPVVNEGVVSVQDVDDAAVLAHDALKEQSRLAVERQAQVAVEIRRLRLGAIQLAKVEPFRCEILDERFRFRLCQHASGLCFKHSRMRKLSCDGQVQQRVIRNTAPQEEGQPRRDFEIAQSIRCALRQIRWNVLHAKNELRVDEYPRKRALDAAIKV